MSERIPPTEAVSETTRGLDELDTNALVARLIDAQQVAFTAVQAVAAPLARAVEAIVARLDAGGTLHYVGAGTSGRLGMLDAAECPPTFGTSPGLVRAHIAGGHDALTRAIEGAEDDALRGEADALAAVSAGDAIVALSASGGPAYVIAWIRVARACGARTIALTADPQSRLAKAAEIAIVLDTGAEPIAGSTRLGAGTAQKIALNAISTAVMVRRGKVYDNLMVDVVATNAKLRARALRLVRMLATADETTASTFLDEAQGSVKTAVVMARKSVDRATARELLERAGGSLRRVLSR